MDDVKFLFYIWVALFYSKNNKVIGLFRKVVEYKNLVKYVCINRFLEFLDYSEIEVFFNVERFFVEGFVDFLLEIKEIYIGYVINMIFFGFNRVFFFINLLIIRDLEFCV